MRSPRSKCSVTFCFYRYGPGIARLVSAVVAVVAPVAIAAIEVDDAEGRRLLRH